MPVPLSPATTVPAALLPIDNPAVEILLAFGVGFVVWGLSRFVIHQVVKRIRTGPQLSEHRWFRWAAPALRALDSERRALRAQTVGSLLNSVVIVIVTTIVGLYILQSLGVNLAPLLASVGIAGIAIGFGAQQLIRDFLAGIFITLEDQFGIGDVIETSEVIGTVESVGLRITRVLADDGTIWYLRNGEILRVGNRSQGDYRPPQENPDEGGPEDQALEAPLRDESHRQEGQRSGE